MPPTKSCKECWIFFVPVVFLAGLVLHVVGFATIHWKSVFVNVEPEGVRFGVNFGLWGFCTDWVVPPAGRSCSNSYERQEVGDVLRGTRAMETIALIGYVATLAIYAFLLLKKLKKVKLAMAVCAFVTGGFALIGVIVYVTEPSGEDAPGTESVRQFEYSLYLCIVAAIVEIIGGILGLVFVKLPNNFNHQDDHHNMASSKPALHDQTNNPVTIPAMDIERVKELQNVEPTEF